MATSRQKSRQKSKQKSKNVNGIIVHYCRSTRLGKKWMTINPQGKKIHWGDSNMKDYTQHHDKKRRSNYRKRHSGILLKDGSKAINKKWSPAWLSYNITW